MQSSQDRYRFNAINNMGQKIIHEGRGAKKGENMLQVKFSSFVVQKLKIDLNKVPNALLHCSRGDSYRYWFPTDSRRGIQHPEHRGGSEDH